MRGIPNRVFWTLMALVLVAAGAGGLALTQGAFGSKRQHRTIITPWLVHQWHQGGNASFEIAGGVAAFAFVVGVLVALMQFRVPRNRRVRLGDLRYGTRHTKGRTVIRGGALRRVVEVDLGRIEGVTRAVAGVFDRGSSTELDTTLDIDGDVNLSAVAGAVEAAVGRWNATTDHPISKTRVLVRLVTRSLDDRHLK